MVNQTLNEKPKSKACSWIFLGIFFLLVFISVAMFSFGTKNFPAIKNSSIIKDLSVNKNSNKTSGIKGFAVMSQNELVNYFITEVTTYGSKTVPLQRWNKDIKVQIEGESDVESLKLINEFIKRFNQNSKTVKMEKVSTGGNFVIQFKDASRKGLPGSAAFGSGNDCFIDGAVVEIGEEVGMLESLPDYTVNHEMFHALGFGGHYRSDVSCTLMSAKHCAKSFTANEDKLIQMLYNSNIPACSTETKIRDFFNK